MTKPKVLISDKMDPNAARIFEERGCDVDVKPGMTPDERLSALERDGVDCEILFPNKGLTIWATPDVAFSQAIRWLVVTVTKVLSQELCLSKTCHSWKMEHL